MPSEGAMHIEIKFPNQHTLNYTLERLPGEAWLFAHPLLCVRSAVVGHMHLLLFDCKGIDAIMLDPGVAADGLVFAFNGDIHLDHTILPQGSAAKINAKMLIKPQFSAFIITGQGLEGTVEQGMLKPDTHVFHSARLLAELLRISPIDMPQLEQQASAFLEKGLSGDTDQGNITEDDVKKLWHAKQYMEEHMQAPPTLYELSRIVGLNDYKLKKEYKAFFGNTVFGHLFDTRMEKARSMLVSGRLPVGEIAYLVGYKNPQHFTAAFKKKYACLPGSLRKD
ncbi:AraC family transcriptional regulator [Pedobacter sp. SYP-B3415]|uniref:helix-turn-helix transcriptional regulator n=1 Tax=Pedobacter sp. SYP-B3415 TaxID=2496641 RepID=UPI00101CE0F7|nr:AraC family transcriptional regulator [Pedobacter sp. SYP-B3415]